MPLQTPTPTVLVTGTTGPLGVSIRGQFNYSHSFTDKRKESRQLLLLMLLVPAFCSVGQVDLRNELQTGAPSIQRFR